MNDLKSHIARLKQQPRQGAGAIDDLLGGLEGAADIKNATLKALGSTANNVGLSIGYLTTEAEKLSAQFKEAMSATSMFEDEAKDLTDTFGINIVKAQSLAIGIGKLSEKFQGGNKFLNQYVQNLKGLVGGFAANEKFLKSDFALKQLKAQEILLTNMKLTGEQANKFAMFAAAGGSNAQQQIIQTSMIANEIEKATGIQGVFRDMLEDVAEVSEDMQMQYSKMPGNLELATVKARQLGLKVADLQKAGKNFLNIEQSISQELEYQLISGRRLVGDKTAAIELQGKSLTNEYRQAMFSRDLNKQANILNQILEQEGDTLENNMLAREQMAQLLGMDEATLARTITKQKLLKEAGVENLMSLSGTALKDAIEKSDLYKTNQTAAENLLKGLQEANTLQTTDEQMAQGIDKMVALMTADMMNKLNVDPMQLFQAMQSTKLEGQGGVNAGMQKLFGNDAAKLVASLLGGASNAANTANLLTPKALKDNIPGASKLIESFQITPKRADIYASQVTLNTTAAKNVNDAILPPASGRAIFGPEGMINLNDRDSVIAGTNLFGSGGGGDVSALAAAVVSAINNQTAELTRNGMNGQYWS
jgi:hypothetical protein